MKFHFQKRLTCILTKLFFFYLGLEIFLLNIFRYIAWIIIICSFRNRAWLPVKQAEYDSNVTHNCVCSPRPRLLKNLYYLRGNITHTRQTYRIHIRVLRRDSCVVFFGTQWTLTTQKLNHDLGVAISTLVWDDWQVPRQRGRLTLYGKPLQHLKIKTKIRIYLVTNTYFS